MESEQVSFRTILMGQKNINQMRSEIKETVALLLSFAHYYLKYQTDDKNKDEVTGGVVFRAPHIMGASTGWYVFTVNEESVAFFKNGRRGYFDSRSSNHDFRQIEDVYDNLQALVDGIFERFPEVRENLRFHIAAGRKQL